MTTAVAPDPARRPPARQEAHDLAAGVVKRLHAAGIDVRRIQPTRLAARRWPTQPGVVAADDRRDPAPLGCELVCVLGGDGTILRGAELSRGSGAPLLGVNLGHVGFLAEAEREDLDATVERIVARDYTVEERMTLEVTAHDDGDAGLLELGAQRGHRREGLPRADARGHRRDRRPAPVDVGLRRRRHGHAHRLDGVRVLRRRPGRVARRRGAAARPDQRPRAVRPPARRRPRSPASPSRSSRTPWAPASCGATAAAPSTCPRARASRSRRSDTPVRLARLTPVAVHRPAGREVRPLRSHGLARRAAPARHGRRASRADGDAVLEEIRIQRPRRHRRGRARARTRA